MIKPLLRGHFHQAAFFTALGACGMLVAKSASSIQFYTSLIYSIGIVGLLGVSALYHRPMWNPQWRMFMRRLDHAMIFVFIATTFTPVSILGMSAPYSTQMLTICWALAAVGIIQCLVWINAPKWLSTGLYLFAAWISLPFFSHLAAGLGPHGVTLLLSGAVIYTVGAFIYTFKKPNPIPHIFGYHEVFHVLVIIAAAFHFVLINSLIGR